MSVPGSQLPDGWAWATVRDLTEFVTSGSRGWAKYYSDDGPAFLRVGNLDHDTVELDLTNTVHVNPPPGAEGKRTRVVPGDILLSITADVGMVGLASSNLGDAFVNQHVALMRPRPTMYSKGFAYSLLDPTGLQKVARDVQYGVTKLQLSLKQVRDFPVPVPPLPEQHRIVEAIESYFTRLDDAVATLERVQANLKRYRASVLKAAVEGRLVPTEADLAREEGRDYEPASVLLERILVERRQRWEAAGKRGKYKEPVKPDTDGLPELPEGWCWTSLGQLKEFSLYGPRFPSSAYSDEGQLVLRTSDISDGGKVNLETAPRIALTSSEFEKYKAEVGDLLITRTGSLGTLVVFNDGVDAIPGAYLIQYRVPPLEPLSWFCFFVFKSPAGQRFLRRAGAGVGRPNLNAPTIESFVFGLPPLAEQVRIRAEVERLLSISDGVELQIQEDRSRCSRLRQSILKWAFEGKLVDQDPDDEPASDLLERIKAEGKTTKKTSRRGRK